MFTCTTNSPEETADLADKLGQKIREGTVLCLEGDLGAGKTLLSRAWQRLWAWRGKSPALPSI